MSLELPTPSTSAHRLIDDILSFKDFGRPTRQETVEGIPYYANEFWTSAQRKSHALHEVSYRACFKAQLPRFFIDRLTSAGNTVMDPFMGRGTTLIEAALAGRNVVGNDINPLSTLLTRPRLCPVDLNTIKTALADIDWSNGTPTRHDLDPFFHPETLRQIEALRLWLERRAPLENHSPDPTADWIRMIALGRLSGHSSGFFSGRSMPPNQAVSLKSQQKINDRLGLTPPIRDVAAIILKKSKSLLRNGTLTDPAIANIQTGPAWRISQPDVSVDLTVTSPPFLDIVDYAGDNWLRCWFAGIDPNAVAIDHHRNIADWTAMVTRVLKDQARVLRPGGIIAFEVGEVRNGRVLLEQLVWKAASDLPFNRLGVMINSQNFTKTANLWGVSNGTKGTNTNRIVLLERR
ncbi:MAG: site-specific DNA-methyltransferase [Boseongicola sp.]|nr:MAG: site-specific DNA-methyltransferase [Boseongicola sp.]